MYFVIRLFSMMGIMIFIGNFGLSFSNRYSSYSKRFQMVMSNVRDNTNNSPVKNKNNSVADNVLPRIPVNNVKNNVSDTTHLPDDMFVLRGSSSAKNKRVTSKDNDAKNNGRVKPTGKSSETTEQSDFISEIPKLPVIVPIVRRGLSKLPQRIKDEFPDERKLSGLKTKGSVKTENNRKNNETKLPVGGNDNFTVVVVPIIEDDFPKNPLINSTDDRTVKATVGTSGKMRQNDSSMLPVNSSSDEVTDDGILPKVKVGENKSVKIADDSDVSTIRTVAKKGFTDNKGTRNLTIVSPDEGSYSSDSDSSESCYNDSDSSDDSSSEENNCALSDWTAKKSCKYDDDCCSLSCCESNVCTPFFLSISCKFNKATSIIS